MIPTADTNLARSRGVQLFRYLQALNELRNPVVRNLDEQRWLLRLATLPEHSSIERGRPSTETEEGDDFLLRVTRPTTTDAPPLPAKLVGWLRSASNVPAAEPQFKREIPIRDETDATVLEAFDRHPD